MIPMTLPEIADVVGGTVHDDTGVTVSGPAFIDSRVAHSDGLFVAVAGERVDGHDYARTAVDAGAAAVLALSPAHADDVRPHYDALAAHAGELAVLAYHFPAVSPPGIPVEVLAELPIAGVKDSSGDAGRLVAELGAYDGPLYVGSSAYLALAGPLGATGAILSLANTDPEGCIAALAGDMEAQRALLPGHRESRVDFPAGLKRRLARLAGTPAAVRAS